MEQTSPNHFDKLYLKREYAHLKTINAELFVKHFQNAQLCPSFAIT